MSLTRSSPRAAKNRSRLLGNCDPNDWDGRSQQRTLRTVDGRLTGVCHASFAARRSAVPNSFGEYWNRPLFTGFLSMRKPSTNKRSKARVRRPTTKALAAPNDPVKRGARQPSPQTNGSLVGALFNSQVAVAQLMYQLSPLPMITRQQAIMLDTFASAFNGALEAHDHAE